MSRADIGTSEAAIIGGGLVGVQCGIELVKEGLNVTLVERDEIGAGASQGNAGVLGAGTCVPMSDPSVPAQMPKWLADPLGPVSIQWMHLPAMTPWILRFIAAGRMTEVKKISIALRDLHKPTVDMYKAVLNETGSNDLVRQNGYLHAYPGNDFKTPPLGAALRQARGVALDFVDTRMLRELEPALSERYTHGFLVKDDGFTVNPHRLTKVLGQYFQELGGRVVKGDVKDFEFENGKPVSMLTNGGRVAVKGDLIIATGVWSSEISKHFGLYSAIEAERGYNVTIPNPGVEVSRVVMLADRKVLITPMEDGLRLAGTTEFSNLQAPPNYKRAAKLLAVGRETLPGLCTENHTQWVGSRPATPDGVPLIGRLQQFESVIMACGHGHTGVAGAPMTAKIVAAMVTKRPIPIDIAAFRPERFGSQWRGLVSIAI